MADKKQNEIIAEQRKARREFLELKKMQADSGEKTYSKEISSLKTPADRIKHIWYYYKWYIISLVALIILISVSVSQCVNATKYDFGIVAFGYYSVTDESLNKLAEYMAQNCEDINGDGEVNIEVINCTYDSSYGNAQYEVAVLTKVQAILSSNYDKLIYITDERGYDYIMNDGNNDGVFIDEPYVFTEEQINRLAENGIHLPQGAQISCRRVKDTFLEGKKNIENIFEQSKRAVEKIKSY